MKTISVLLISCVPALCGEQWSKPAEVLHEMKPCVTYRARIAGEHLIVRAVIEPGWHTFTMDNEQRSAEKLAGRQSLGVDQPTRIDTGRLSPAGPWYQSQPKDFSKPELRWFSWGFEREALFVARLKPGSSSEPAEIGIRGQACTETTCKNIDLRLSVPPASADPATGFDVDKLVQVR